MHIHTCACMHARERARTHTGTVLPETQKCHQRGHQGIAAGRRDHSRGCEGSHLEEASQAQGVGSMLAHELPVPIEVFSC